MFTTQRPKVMSWVSHSSHHVRMWDGYRMPYFFFFLVAMQVVKVVLVIMGLSFRKSLDIYTSIGLQKNQKEVLWTYCRPCFSIQDPRG